MNEHGNYRDNPTNSYKSNISLTKYNYRANVDVSLSKSTTLDLELGGWLIDSHNPGMTSSELLIRHILRILLIFLYVILMVLMRMVVNIMYGLEATPLLRRILLNV